MVCPGSGENVSELVARAEALNSERVVLAAPADGTRAERWPPPQRPGPSPERTTPLCPWEARN